MATKAEFEDATVVVALLACAGASCSIGNDTSHASSSSCWSSSRLLHLQPRAALHGGLDAALADAFDVKIRSCSVPCGCAVFFVMVLYGFVASPGRRLCDDES